MVRYFRFLANRVCGEKLPQVYKVPGMDKPGPMAKVCYVQMVKQFLNRDPVECVLCGGRMVYRRAVAWLNVSGLKKNARDISLLRHILADAGEVRLQSGRGIKNSLLRYKNRPHEERKHTGVT